MKVLIDNGHGEETKGKRSPDGALREYRWARECARLVVEGLHERGIDAALLVPETRDVSLGERCKRANEVCAKVGAKNVLLVSIHNNAAGNGAWMSARGWSVYVDTTASTRSKIAASFLSLAAEKQGLRVRRPTPSEGYWTQSLYILKHTTCPAVLTENLFMDDEDDCAYLLSDEGKAALVTVHVDGIMNYLKSLDE